MRARSVNVINSVGMRIAHALSEFAGSLTDRGSGMCRPLADRNRRSILLFSPLLKGDGLRKAICGGPFRTVLRPKLFKLQGNHMKKQIALLAVAVGLAGSAFAAGKDVNSSNDAGPMVSKDHLVKQLIRASVEKDKRDEKIKASMQYVTVSIEDLVRFGYIKPKDGVEIVYGYGPGYIVMNTKTGSHFVLTNESIVPISVKGKATDEGYRKVADYPGYNEFRPKSDACLTNQDVVKNYECLINLAATL